MRRKIARAVKQATNITIDDIDGASTPSLIAYYKCSDAADGVIPDHSGNGYDLSVNVALDGANSFSTLQEMLAFKAGYLSVKRYDGGEIDITGTLLDTQDKVVLVCCDMYYDNDGTRDIDAGTSHDINERGTDPYQGWMVGGAGTSNYFRATKYVDPNPNYYFNQTTVVSGQAVIAGAFIPSTAVYNSVNGEATKTTTLGVPVGDISTVSSLLAQDGKFAITGVDAVSTSVRNYQVWAWDAADAPSNAVLSDTVKWLSTNPGKIPKWLIGK